MLATLPISVNLKKKKKKNTGAETIRACGRGTPYPRTKIQFDKCKEPALNSFFFSYNLDRCILESFKQSLKCQSFNYY
jgi:hypothetical protein